MKRPAFLTAAAAALLAAATASAQTPTVEARIVPDSIGIGDTFTLEIDVERDQVQVTEFPLYENDDKLEVVQSLPVDTLSREGRRLRLRKRYVMQAFSEGRYNLGRPGVLYADKNIVDTLYTSESLRLDVGTFQIDTAKQTIYDLKPQRTLPLRAEEITGYLFGGLFLLLNLAALLFALRYHLSKRGKHLSDLFKPAPPAPPHVEAIRALEGLHNQKLWQNNKHKAYYSGPLSGGALRHRRLGDDLRRDHRCGTSARPAPQERHGAHGAAARSRSGEIRQGDARSRTQRRGLPVGLLLRRGDQTRRGTTFGRSGGAARPDA